MKWYQSNWATWLFLILFFPVGLFFLWKYSSYSIKTKSIISVIFVALIVGSAFGSDKKNNNVQQNQSVTVKKENQKSTEQKKIETSVQQQIPQKVATLHVNPTNFQQNYNQIMATEMGQMGASGMFNMPAPQIQKGNGQDVVQYTFEDGVIFMELIDPNSNEIKEIMITAMLPSGDTDAMRANLMAALMLYTASLRASNLNLTSNDVQAIQNELGLNQSVDKWIKNTSTSRGNIRYSKQIAPKIGLAFIISAQ